MRARLPMVFKFTDGKVVSCLVAPVPLEWVRCQLASLAWRRTRVVVCSRPTTVLLMALGAAAPLSFSKGWGSGSPEGLKEPVFQGEIPG